MPATMAAAAWPWHRLTSGAENFSEYESKRPHAPTAASLTALAQAAASAGPTRAPAASYGWLLLLLGIPMGGFYF